MTPIRTLNLQDLNGAAVRAAVRLGLPVQAKALTGANVARTLQILARKLRIFEPQYVDISVRHSKHDATVDQSRVAFVNPSLMAKFLFEHVPNTLLGSDGQAKTFWEMFRLKNPMHPLNFLDLDVDLDLCFPYALHGDEGSGLAEARRV